MKRSFSVLILCTMLVFCVSIGVSGFRSQSSYEPPGQTKLNLQKSFGMEDFGMFKERVDLPTFPIAYNYVESVDGEKPDNIHYQLIHWDLMRYENRL